MNIHVPYTNLRDDTKAALDLHAIARGHTVTYVDVSGSESAMWEMWRDLWAQGDDIVVVEHDIVIHEEVLPRFEDCPNVWCANPYPYAFGNSDPYHGTGCVRFRAALTVEFPDLWERVGQRKGPKHPQRHWCSLDGWSQLELWPRNYRQCHHTPAVGHVDPTNSHGCLGNF
ncbi:MAG TPA: hypothetical protein VMV41_09780 [Cellulomonadaceae bacterium]|nr:hypothetical protein [Cellulomonadaceae bacterium]